MLLGLLMLLLAACQQNDANVSEEQEQKDTPEQQAEDESDKSGEDEVVEEDEPDVNAGKETKALTEIEAEALHKWALTDGTTAVLVGNQEKVNIIEYSSALGMEGEREYQGDVALYIVHEGETEGYLQERLADESLNLDRAFSEPYLFREESIITWSQPEASNTLTTKMWRYSNGELLPVLFDGADVKVWSNQKMKFLQDTYLQGYYYNNHDIENGIGWYYETWKWDEEKGEFTLHDEKSYTDAEEYGWESGEYITENWHEIEEEYVLFPEITLTEDLLQNLADGRFVKDGFQIGTPIDDVLAKMPDYTAHEYYEGGFYYAFPGMFSYFYDELTHDVSFITMAGASITNDLASLKKILGEPKDEWYDEVNMNYSTEYDIEEYHLRIEHDGNGNVTGLWLNSLDFYES